MHLSIGLLLLLITSEVSPTQVDISEHWENFKKLFGKSYEPEEEKIRSFVFGDNLRFIIKHNLEADMGTHTYSLGINQFTDLTHEEYKEKFSGSAIDEENDIPVSTFDSCALTEVAEENVDYREDGMITDVKDQGECGASYAFATTGSLEGIWKKKSGKLVSLSEQNIIDCYTSEESRGCVGGDIKKSFAYILTNGGINSKESYPYEQKKNSCRFKKENIAATITGFEAVKNNSEEDLKKAVSSIGTIACGINGKSRDFMAYKSGIFSDPTCKGELNHAVTLVGYGEENEQEYWLLKNQFGKTWGEQGYMKLARNKNNLCGIASFCFYPKV